MPEIHLNGPIGRLEARYTHNNEANSPAVLILHAHPGHGGNMNNPLSLKIHKFFSDMGFSSLRFNFRGVGKSDGEHDGSEGELADSATLGCLLQLIQVSIAEGMRRPNFRNSSCEITPSQSLTISGMSPTTS